MSTALSVKPSFTEALSYATSNTAMLAFLVVVAIFAVVGIYVAGKWAWAKLYSTGASGATGVTGATASLRAAAPEHLRTVSPAKYEYFPSPQ